MSTLSHDFALTMVALTLHTLVIGRPREVDGKRAPGGDAGPLAVLPFTEPDPRVLHLCREQARPPA